MVHACTNHSAMFVKPQQWPTPSDYTQYLLSRHNIYTQYYYTQYHLSGEGTYREYGNQLAMF